MDELVPDLESLSPRSYDRFTILFHWATAALVVLQWIGGELIDVFPPGVQRVNARSVHILLGAVLVAVLAARIAWRVRSGRRLPAVTGGLLGTAERAGQYVLYVLLAGAVLLGLSNAWIRGDVIFGLFQIPAYDPTDRALRARMGGLHELAAHAIFIAAGAHALVALLHHLVLGNPVLARMGIGRARP